MSIARIFSGKTWGNIIHFLIPFAFNDEVIFRYIHSKNRAGLTYRLAPNHLTDMGIEDMRQLRGKLYSKGYNGGLPFPHENNMENLPDQLDWRLVGAVSSVKGKQSLKDLFKFSLVIKI